MKPVIAQRVTTCHHCKEPIVAGSQRLTDVIPKFVHGEKRYFTRHFHFSNDGQNCMILWATEVFETLPVRIRTNNPKGRPSLGLSSDKKTIRDRLLKKIHNQIRYYILNGKLNLEPQFITEFTEQDLRRAKRFRNNIQESIDALKDVGGVPAQYLVYDNEPETMSTSE